MFYGVCVMWTVDVCGTPPARPWWSIHDVFAPLSGSANYVFDAAHLRTLAYRAFGVGGTCVAKGVAEVADDLLWDR